MILLNSALRVVVSTIASTSGTIDVNASQSSKGGSYAARRRRSNLRVKTLFAVATVAAGVVAVAMVVGKLPESAEEFSCGGGPLSFYAASLVSTSCDRQMIHSCCEAHDHCYEARYLNQSYCDAIFCGCMAQIPTTVYCASVAQPSLCLATQMFGHMFHWSAFETVDDGSSDSGLYAESSH